MMSSRPTKLAFGVEPSNRRFRLRLARYPDLAEKIAKLSGTGECTNVLDLGCGDGRLCRYCQVVQMKRPLRLFGIDISRKRLTYAKRWFGKDLTRGDGMRLPFRDGVFDAVICSHVLEHVPDPARLLAEARRVLRRGGVLIVGVPIVPDAIAKLMKRFPVVEKVKLHLFGHNRNHLSVFSFQELEALLSSEGFQVVGSSAFRLFSLWGNLLEDYLWWYRLQRMLARAVPQLAQEVNVVARTDDFTPAKKARPPRMSKTAEFAASSPLRKEDAARKSPIWRPCAS